MSDTSPYPGIKKPYEAWQGEYSGWVPVTGNYARGWLKPGGHEAGDFYRLSRGETLEFFGGAFKLRKRRADAE